MRKELWVALAIGSLMLVAATAYAHLVRYPELRDTPAESFRDAHARHTAQFGLFIGLPFVFVPVIVGLLAVQRPTLVSVAAAGCMVIAHGVTLAVSAPCHARLSAGFDAGTMERLMGSNPPRFAAWLLLAAISFYAAWRE